MKKLNKKQINVALYVVGVVALVTLGVVGTLKYQSFINNVKEQGVAEFKVNHCDKYSDPKNKQNWLECDE